MTLEVLIATHRPEGILKVAAMGLPELSPVRYLVSWQQDEGAMIPEELACRSDVTICRTDSIGLSHNRNNALRHASGDVVLISDNDVTYRSEQLLSVLDTFMSNSQMELAVFQSDGSVARSYPACEQCLNRSLKGYSPVSFEMAFRRDAIMKRQIWFHPEFGLGSERFWAAEDDLFLITCIKRGVSCWFYPITIVTHHGVSTGQRCVTDARVYQAFGAYIALVYPWSAVIRLPLKIFRGWRSGLMGPLMGLWYMTRGALFAGMGVTKPWSAKFDVMRYEKE